MDIKKESKVYLLCEYLCKSTNSVSFRKYYEQAEALSFSQQSSYILFRPYDVLRALPRKVSWNETWDKENLHYYLNCVEIFRVYAIQG